MDEYWRAGGSGIRLAAADKPHLGPHTLISIAVELAKRVIEAYRSENGLWDLFGHKDGAVTSQPSTEEICSNSSSPTYTSVDRAAAVRLRKVLSEKYPDKFATNNIGRMPSDALFHAETTVLLRAARQSGGLLTGRTLTVFGDTVFCNNCRDLLPYIGLELGNPTVTFVDPNGSSRTMRDGSWM